MAVKYHINPKTKRPNLCTAKHYSSCLYYDAATGTAAMHFSSKPEAREYVEKELNKEYGKVATSVKKKNPIKNPVDNTNDPLSNSFNIVKKFYGVEEVYYHPQGKIIKIEDGVAVAYKNGKKGTTTATTEKLRAGYGKWERVTDSTLDPPLKDEKIKSIKIKPKPKSAAPLPIPSKVPVSNYINKPKQELLDKFTHEDELYINPKGKIMYIDDCDNVLAYDQYGNPTNTVVTAEKLRKGFGSWKKYEIEPPAGWKPKSKTKLYAEEQEKLIKKLSKFINDNPGDFKPKGKVQSKYWNSIKEGVTEGKSTAIKDTMIKTAFSAISDAGYNIDKTSVTALGNNPTLLSTKEELQKKQKEAINQLFKDSATGAKKSSYVPVAHKKKPGPKANPFKNSPFKEKQKPGPKPGSKKTSYVKTGISYNSLNKMEEVDDFVKKERKQIGTPEKMGGLTFTKYAPTSFTKKTKPKQYTSTVDVTGNIKNFDFTSDPEIYKKFGFQGKKGFSVSAKYDETVNRLSDVSVSKLTGVEKSALTWFTGSSYQAFNKVMFRRRQINENMDEYKSYKKKMEAMDKALAKAPKVNKVVYRSMQRSASIFSTAPGIDMDNKINNYIDSNYKVGKTIEFKGYQSATTDPNLAKDWGGGGGVLFEIMTPEGMPVKSISHHKSESEVILPRESRYVVVGRQKTKYGQHVIQMIAVNDNGDILDGTNSGKKSTWEELMSEPLVS